MINVKKRSSNLVDVFSKTFKHPNPNNPLDFRDLSGLFNDFNVGMTTN